MKFYGDLNRIIGEGLINENSSKSRKHQSSGKLSPSKLAYTTQSAVLALLGVPADPFDHKVLGIFARGQAVEKSVLGLIGKRHYVEQQRKIEYRGCVGYADAIICGEVIEVKSVRPTKFIRLLKERKPQVSHAIQTCFYLAGTGTNKGRIAYVSSDNLDTLELPIYRNQYQAELDKRIDAVQKAIMDRALPDYAPLEDMHKSAWYTPYRLFFNTKGEEAEAILKDKYPEAYSKLKEGSLQHLCENQQSKS